MKLQQGGPNTMDKKLIVNEIFASISGECNRFHQGRITTFIRLQGCNLKCPYCDTPESQRLIPSPIVLMTINEIVNEVKRLGHKNVLITGGEPSIQHNFLDLCQALKNDKFIVTVETNGTIDFSLDNIDCCVVDWKFDKVEKMNMKRFTSLRKDKDVIKFVVQNQAQVLRAEICMKVFGLEHVTYAFSPITNSISVKELADILISRKLNVVLSLQIHKMCDFK